MDRLDEKPRSTSPLVNALARVAARPYAVLTVLAMAFFAILIVYPLGRIVFRTFIQDGQFSLADVISVFSAPWLPTVLFNTVVVVGVSTVIAVAVGVVLAWVNERTDAGFGTLGTILPVIPLLLPGVAIAIGWVFIGAPRVGYINGLLSMLPAPLNWLQVNINSWGGLIFVFSLNGIPYVYLVVSAALKNVDPALEEASRISGAGLLRTLRSVSLPVVGPAIISATLLAFINGLGTFSTAVIIGTPAQVDLLTTRIVTALTRSFPPDFAAAQILSLIMLVAVGFVWWGQTQVARSGRFVALGGKASGSAMLPLGRWRWLARSYTIVVILVTTILPATALLIVALQPYWTPTIDIASFSLRNFNEVLFVNRVTVPAFQNSVMLAFVGASIAMAIAILSAVFMSGKRNWLGSSVDFFLKVPAILPHLIIAVGLLLSFGGAPFYLSGTPLILLLALVVMYISPGAIAASSAVDQVGNDLKEASRIAGASEGRTVWRVVMPLSLGGFVAGWTIVFVHMMGDLSAAAILAGLKTPVVGYAMLEIWESGTFGVLAAFSVVLCIANLTIVGLMMGLINLYRKYAF